MNGLVSRLLGTGILVGLALVASTSAQAQVTTSQNITFGGLPFGNPTVTSYGEAGYTLMSVSGTILGTSGNGNPAPAIFTRDPAVFNLTNGSLFGLTSVDIGTGAFVATRASYTVTGYLNNTATFNDVFSTASSSFQTHTFNSGSLLFDRVNFAFEGMNGFAADIDNIRLFSVATVAPSVPEPSSWAMVILGTGAIGFAMRRRQKVRVSYAA